jgi:hypothetical protein
MEPVNPADQRSRGVTGSGIGVELRATLALAMLWAHQLVLNCAGISFMVPLGLSQAATVRVAYRLRSTSRTFALDLATGTRIISPT